MFKRILFILVAIFSISLLAIAEMDDADAGVVNVTPLTGSQKTPIAITVENDACEIGRNNHWHFAKFNGQGRGSNICYTKTITVPMTGVSIGKNTLLIEMGDKYTVTSTASFEFIILQPELNSVTPSSGQPGASVSFSGSNLPANHDIKVFLGGQQVKTIRSNSAGSISGSFTVPTLTQGNYNVELTWDGGVPSGLDSSYQIKFFNILPPPASPTLTLSPSVPKFGQYVTFSGSNFEPNKGLSIGMIGNNIVSSTNICFLCGGSVYVQTDASGNFEKVEKLFLREASYTFTVKDPFAGGLNY